MVDDEELSGRSADREIARAVFGTNVVGVVRVTQAAIPLLRKSGNPVVVNISSALGSFWALADPGRPRFHVPLHRDRLHRRLPGRASGRRRRRGRRAHGDHRQGRSHRHLLGG
ncbi:MAG TPA: hypothetical protein VKV35_05940 [Streptosporangiaceae bacterium]|nr:hypothetical protein [Streptosporangiaceae bacterium]